VIVLTIIKGIVVVAVITWFIATFGIKFFHYYERYVYVFAKVVSETNINSSYAFLPQVIVVCILYGVSAKKYNLETPSVGDSLTIAGNRLSFFSICLSAAITYAPLAADFFVYYPPDTPKVVSFGLTFLGLTLSFTMAFIVGIGLASGIASDTGYADAYNVGAGALIVEGFNPLGGFGKFCSVLVALGLISNTIPPTYSSGIDFQILGHYAEMVPRIVWNTIAVVIYTVCALAGQAHLSEIFTNFLALMGYWVAIWFAILLEERYIFRRQTGYNWAAWDDPSKLPIGLAAFAAFLVGWAGAVICMAQVWYIGPIAKLVGDYGADVSFLSSNVLIIS
jgi:purine-cytosine permease-like protein